MAGTRFFIQSYFCAVFAILLPLAYWHERVPKYRSFPRWPFNHTLKGIARPRFEAARALVTARTEAKRPVALSLDGALFQRYMP